MAWAGGERRHTPRSRTHARAGGTRFIGLYLARQLVEQGHDVTLFTRGKKQVTYEIPDDTPASFQRFARSVKHIAGDRMVRGPLHSSSQSTGALHSLALDDHLGTRGWTACTSRAAPRSVQDFEDLKRKVRREGFQSE